MQKEFFKQAKLNYQPQKEPKITFTSSINIEEYTTLESICHKLNISYVPINENANPNLLINFIKSFKNACQKYSFVYDPRIDLLLKNDELIKEFNSLNKHSCDKEIELSYFFTILDYKNFSLTNLKNELKNLEKEKEIIKKINNKNLLCGALIDSKFVRNYLKEEQIKSLIRAQKSSIVRDIFVLVMDNPCIRLNELIDCLGADRINVLKVVFYLRDSGIILFDAQDEFIRLNV